jgi:hypothetical protein
MYRDGSKINYKEMIYRMHSNSTTCLNNNKDILYLTNEELNFLHEQGVNMGLFPSKNNPVNYNPYKTGQIYKYLAKIYNMGYYK